MVKSKDEIMNAVKARFGDDSSDETLSFIEDISDTYDDLEKQVKDSGEWKQKYEENDKEWRDKYKERFFSSDETTKNEPEEQEDEKPKALRFEDLFTTNKEK